MQFMIISQQQITCYCLLDLSAAFDTIDHSILIERLSYLLWFSSRFCSWSIFIHSLYYVLLLALSSLSVVLIIIFMQITLSSLFLLVPQNFSETLLFLKILLLKSVLGCLPIYNLLKASKTDCLLVDLPKQLSKLNNPTDFRSTMDRYQIQLGFLSSVSLH